jgi:nucleotidyltransferase/DNA polymerase involved in DNA repair
MKKLGIFTARDLRAKDEAFLLRYFGKAGRHFYWICRSIDRRPLLPTWRGCFLQVSTPAPRSPISGCRDRKIAARIVLRELEVLSCMYKFSIELRDLRPGMWQAGHTTGQ